MYQFTRGRGLDMHGPELHRASRKKEAGSGPAPLSCSLYKAKSSWENWPPDAFREQVIDKEMEQYEYACSRS